jgi:hypothetical protein
MRTYWPGQAACEWELLRIKLRPRSRHRLQEVASVEALGPSELPIGRIPSGDAEDIVQQSGYRYPVFLFQHAQGSQAPGQLPMIRIVERFGQFCNTAMGTGPCMRPARAVQNLSNCRSLLSSTKVSSRAEQDVMILEKLSLLL